jgi:hypothetical protein
MHKNRNGQILKENTNNLIPQYMNMTEEMPCFDRHKGMKEVFKI